MSDLETLFSRTVARITVYNCNWNDVSLAVTQPSIISQDFIIKK